MRSGDCRPRGQGRENALESGPDWKADKMQGGEEGKWTLETRGHPRPSSAPLAELQQGARWPAVRGRLWVCDTSGEFQGFRGTQESGRTSWRRGSSSWFLKNEHDCELKAF